MSSLFSLQSQHCMYYFALKKYSARLHGQFHSPAWICSLDCYWDFQIFKWRNNPYWFHLTWSTFDFLSLDVQDTCGWEYICTRYWFYAAGWTVQYGMMHLFDYTHSLPIFSLSSLIFSESNVFSTRIWACDISNTLSISQETCTC